MDRKPVSSSNLKSVGYDPAANILEIEFNGGQVYQYFNVPESIYKALMSATSKGRYLHANIKNSYRYKQIR